jgi:hypothetical protein
MKLTPPKAATFWISILIVVFGALVPTLLPSLEKYDLVIVIVGFVLLALGNMIKGL